MKTESGMSEKLKSIGVMDLSNLKPLGYTWDGKFFLLGEPGPVSVERFNEVCGTPNITFSVTDDDE